MNLPTDIADLVWSYDASTLDSQKSPEIVIRSVLRLGSWDQIMWTFAHFGREQVKAVIERDYFGDRSLPVSVRAFWGNVFWPEFPPLELADPKERWRPTRVRPEADAVEVQRRLKDAVAASGMSQASFAAMLGTSQPRLSTYLSGKVVPSARLLVRAERVAGSPR